MLLLDLYNTRPIWGEVLGLLAAFGIGMTWAWITERRKRRMKDRIDRAVDTIRGYCAKVTHCDNCRFRQGTDGSCPFMVETTPCDWDMDKRREAKP